MAVTIEVVRNGAAERWTPEVRAVLNAGWAGRDTALVRAHVEEMRALGVPPPDEVPIVFPVARAMLTQGRAIEIYTPASSGEVEYVLIVARDRAVLTVGSDHTDRQVEAHSIELSKRVCPNVMAETAWDYADVAGHVDDLVLRAWVREQGRWQPYQEGGVATLLPPAYWLGRLTPALSTVGGGPASNGAVVLFSGTIPTLGGALRSGDGFRVSLEDPRRGRTIMHEYDVALVENPLRGSAGADVTSR